MLKLFFKHIIIDMWSWLNLAVQASVITETGLSAMRRSGKKLLPQTAGPVFGYTHTNIDQPETRVTGYYCYWVIIIQVRFFLFT